MFESAVAVEVDVNRAVEESERRDQEEFRGGKR